MISVCIVSPAWGRFDVTRMVLEQRQRLCEELTSRGVDAAHLIVADDENLEIACEFGGIAVEAPNRPLGRKCNIGLHRAAELGADFIVWIGSDDWIHPDTFRTLPVSMENEPVLVRSGFRLSMVDLHTGRLQRLKVHGRYGAVPWIIDARLFRRLPILPIQEDLKRGLDGGLVRGLRLARVPFEFAFDDPNDFRCVDFKSNHNLTPYDGLAKHIGVNEPENAWQTLAKHFPADLVAKARELSGNHEANAVHVTARKEHTRVARLQHPETGQMVSVSDAGRAILLARGYIDPDAPAEQSKTAAPARRKTPKPKAA